MLTRRLPLEEYSTSAAVRVRRARSEQALILDGRAPALEISGKRKPPLPGARDARLPAACRPSESVLPAAASLGLVSSCSTGNPLKSGIIGAASPCRARESINISRSFTRRREILFRAAPPLGPPREEAKTPAALNIAKMIKAILRLVKERRVMLGRDPDLPGTHGEHEHRDARTQHLTDHPHRGGRRGSRRRIAARWSS